MLIKLYSKKIPSMNEKSAQASAHFLLKMDFRKRKIPKAMTMAP